MRKKLFAANWKMHKTVNSTGEFAVALRRLAADSCSEIVVCPPAILLTTAVNSFSGSPISVGAQNVCAAPAGAYTGEISVAHLEDAFIRYCIVGHSERRTLFGESNADVAAKTNALLSQGMTPILCLGETLAERQNGETLAVLRRMLCESLDSVEISSRLVLAYEPLWAIGSGINAEQADVEQACAYLRQLLRELCGGVADDIRILYGGSVKPVNIAEIMCCPNVDGVLVGGASLQAETFAEIIRRGEAAGN